MLLGYDWSEDHPQSQRLFFGQFFGLMNNPGSVGFPEEYAKFLAVALYYDL
jgi:RsiW-degrading membrane proteinase PrsW (M82 family)